MTVKLLTKQHLVFLSLKGGCTGSSESTHVKMSHCWKSHVAAQMQLFKYVDIAGKIEFTPGLPTVKKELFKRMPSSNLTKVIATYKTVRFYLLALQREDSVFTLASGSYYLGTLFPHYSPMGATIHIHVWSRLCVVDKDSPCTLGFVVCSSALPICGWRLMWPCLHITLVVGEI